MEPELSELHLYPEAKAMINRKNYQRGLFQLDNRNNFINISMSAYRLGYTLRLGGLLLAGVLSHCEAACLGCCKGNSYIPYIPQRVAYNSLLCHFPFQDSMFLCRSKCLSLSLFFCENTDCRATCLVSFKGKMQATFQSAHSSVLQRIV